MESAGPADRRWPTRSLRPAAFGGLVGWLRGGLGEDAWGPTRAYCRSRRLDHLWAAQARWAVVWPGDRIDVEAVPDRIAVMTCTCSTAN